MKEKIKNWLQQGIDSNILVFDSDAPKGVITKRLISLMSSIARTTYKHNIKIIYMDERENASVERTIGLDWDELKVQKTFEEMGGTMQYEDEKLVIGILENEQILLGSY